MIPCGKSLSSRNLQSARRHAFRPSTRKSTCPAPCHSSPPSADSPPSQSRLPIPSHSSSVCTPTVTASGEFWRNAQGGAQTGSRWNTLVDLGLAIDLEKLGAPRGSQFVGQLFWVK